MDFGNDGPEPDCHQQMEFNKYVTKSESNLFVFISAGQRTVWRKQSQTSGNSKTSLLKCTSNGNKMLLLVGHAIFYLPIVQLYNISIGVSVSELNRNSIVAFSKVVIQIESIASYKKLNDSTGFTTRFIRFFIAKQLIRINLIDEIRSSWPKLRTNSRKDNESLKQRAFVKGEINCMLEGVEYHLTGQHHLPTISSLERVNHPSNSKNVSFFEVNADMLHAFDQLQKLHAF